MVLQSMQCYSEISTSMYSTSMYYYYASKRSHTSKAKSMPDSIGNYARIGRRKHQKAWKQEIRRDIIPIRYNVIHIYSFFC